MELIRKTQFLRNFFVAFLIGHVYDNYTLNCKIVLFIKIHFGRSELTRINLQNTIDKDQGQ